MAPETIAVSEELTPEQINRLPLKRYDGRVEIVRGNDQIADAIQKLRRERILGFDTETRPAFKKGTYFRPALVQMATAESVYLFQIRQTGFVEEIRGVLSDSRIVKAGIGLGFDVRELRALEEFEPAGFLDLSNHARASGLKKVSLRTLAATFLGFRISKGAKCSNWAVPRLSDSQIRYAATDAWVSRCLFLRMDELGLLVQDEDSPAVG